MSNTNALFPVVRDEIDFETLLAQAIQVLKTSSGQYWTDMAEHDPGITLLDAQGYGVADLAYRQTRPLTDLLTPEVQPEGEGLFPPEFGPQQALTCGPISEADYRRALLDLRSTDTEDGYFLFLNAQLIREPDSERYTYWYNTVNREYSFMQPSTADGPVSMTLLGNYHLYLVPSRETLLTPQATETAQMLLDTFLLNNRNLGEAVSRIVWLTPDDLNVQLEVELEDDIGTNSNIAAILADIYQVAENYVAPAVRHASTEQLQAEGMRSEDIHQGPWLQYGWIPRLPPPMDGTNPAIVNLSGLVSALQNVAGVKGIRHLEALTDNTASSRWQWVASGAGVYPRLWGNDPLMVLAAGEMVKLLASGDVQLTASRAAIAAEIEVPVLVRNLPPELPFGRWRDPGRYYPSTDLIPPCYNLRVPALSEQQIRLHQFLLMSEQLLANGCQHLALLPALLAFRREGDVVWGHQWPFRQDSVSDSAHAAYSRTLKTFLEQSSHDREQELAITGFLLGYFNSLLAPAVFSQPADRFLASQQGFLSRHTELTYHRSNIRVDQVSSLHRRIAARLGLGGAEIFNDNTRLDQLPFYLVEHRALMPVPPAARYDGPQTPVDVRVEITGGIEYLVLSGGNAWEVVDLAAGQLIDIFVGHNTPNVLHIRGQMVKRVNRVDNSFWLDIGASAQLEYQLDDILAASPGELAWQNSVVWLEDMTWPLTYGSQDADLTEDQKRLSCTPFPVMVTNGDLLTLVRPASRNAEAQPEAAMNLIVISVDRIQNTLVVQKTASDTFPEEEMTTYWFWHFTTNRLATADRFSFMSSVVFNQNLLLGLTSDPYATETWVREMILAEAPSHTGVLIHWKPRWEFDGFAATYRKWLDSGSALGDASYDLMYLLALGELPDEMQGIGSLYIATADQRDIALGVSDGWDEAYIEEEYLFHVPRVGVVTLSVVTSGAVANGVDTNCVTATVQGVEGNLIAGVEVHFRVDNGATMASKGLTDANGSVTMTLTSFIPGTCTVTASYNDVHGKAEVAFVAPLALNGTLAVNGHTFSVSDGFPTTGFTQASFRVQLTGDTNSNYTWSVSQPWVSVDDDGNVTFTGEPTGTTKTVRLLLVPKSGSGNSYTWTFTVNHWFKHNGSNKLNWNDANILSSSVPDYKQPSRELLSTGGNSRIKGCLFGEWGDVAYYSGSGFSAAPYWSSTASSSGYFYWASLSNGNWEWGTVADLNYVISCKVL